MTTHIAKIEKKGLVRIPQEILEQAGFTIGEELEAKQQKNSIVLSKKESIVSKLKGRIRIGKETAHQIITSEEIEHEAL